MKQGKIEEICLGAVCCLLMLVSLILACYL